MPSVPGSVVRFFGRRHAIPAGSGTVGLAVALRAVPVEGRRVLIPAASCPNVAVSVVAAGGVPVLVDMSASTYDFSLEALAGALAPGAAAVVAIDAFGYPGAFAAVARLARDAGCVVVEDACQAYGGYHEGKPLGARGDVSVVSFGYAKPLELRGGGLVLTDDDALAARMRRIMASPRFRLLPSMKNRFVLRFMFRDDYGRMLAWQRRFGLLEYTFPPRLLRRLEERFDRWAQGLPDVRGHLDRVRESVRRLPGVVPFEYEGGDWLPWRYSFKVPEPNERAALIDLLARRGIRTSRLYRPVNELIDAGTAGSIDAARALADATVNLVYRTEADDTRALAGRLERLVEQEVPGV